MLEISNWDRQQNQGKLMETYSQKGRQIFPETA